MNTEEVRALYISSKASYKEIAERYGVSETYVARIAKRDGWRSQRAAFRKDIAEEALTRIKERGARDLVKLSEASDKICSLINRIASDEDQFFRWIGRDGEMILQKADTRSLRNFAAALSEMVRVVRDLYDIPGVLEEQREKREERKIQLLEKREGDIADSQAGVVFLPPVLVQVEDGVKEVQE